MDTKYQGNTFRLPIISVCTLNKEGHIEILLKCLISKEVTETFRWILDIFHEHYGIVLNYRTDKCAAMLNAIEWV